MLQLIDEFMDMSQYEMLEYLGGGGIFQGVHVLRVFVLGGKCPWGLCPGVYVQGVFVHGVS